MTKTGWYGKRSTMSRQRLIEMRGGTVEARNSGGEPGGGQDVSNGAELIVKLPANVKEPGEAAPVRTATAESANAPGNVQPMRILVVDDNIDSADSIALLLTMDGFDAHSVHSATAALDAAGSFKPDVVLLDIGLPVMDGYEVAKRLRARIPVERIRIVALSGYGQQADRDRAVQAGFDDYLVKPVEPTVLGDFLRALR